MNRDDLLKLQEEQREKIIDSLFKEWSNTDAQDVGVREALHAEFRAFKKLTFRTTRSIKGGRDV